MTTGAAYFTDSFRPVLFRVPLSAEGVGEIEPWLDLDRTPIRYEPGFNLNGIAATPDGRFLLTVQYNTGRLFRIDTRSKAITEVALEGEVLNGGDGLVLDGQTLYVVAGGQIVPVQLSADFASGTVAQGFADPSLRYPTTVAGPYEGLLLVVNSQLDRAGGGDGPQLPFAISAVPIP